MTTVPARLRKELIYRCTGCGLPRYGYSRPCHTCALFDRRRYIANPTAYWQGRGAHDRRTA